jgi:hypothetical protein
MSSLRLTIPTTRSPLHLLAHVALDLSEKSNGAGTPLQTVSEQTVPSTSLGSPPTRSLHIPCGNSTSAPNEPKPLRRSSTSNSLHADSSSSTSSRTAKASKKHTQKATRSLQTAKANLKARRRECMERALRIKSLENSPVNDRQLHVLRMVYDEITMYPSEAWMVLIAIVINRYVLPAKTIYKDSSIYALNLRAFKQVKNWFSNERQKQKVGQVVSIRTDTGEKLRLRTQALQLCQEWSDSFFEEVVMIHHFKILRWLRWKETQMAAASASSRLY